MSNDISIKLDQLTEQLTQQDGRRHRWTSYGHRWVRIIRAGCPYRFVDLVNGTIHKAASRYQPGDKIGTLH